MRHWWLFVSTLLCLIQTALADPVPKSPAAANATAKFSVDDAALSLVSAVATVEARRGAPGYSWLRIYFYAFPPDADDIAGAMKGSVQSMEQKWEATAVRPSEYNTSHAVIQLTVDKDARITQVDMSIPGHTCTITAFEPDAMKFAQNYQFHGGKLQLKAKGAHVCDMAFMGIPNQNFAWDIDVDVPVFAKAN
jgi:hypothetical protein